MPSTARNYVHIAVGVLFNARGEVLICQRPAHKIYPGEWEFPGGKVEIGEPVERALARELHEELDITVRGSRPLIRLRHAYPELAADLDTWIVTAYNGEPKSTEHSAMAWVAPGELLRWPLLAADRPIVNAIRLPDQFVFTPPQAGFEALARGLEHLPTPSFLRLRLPELSDEAYADVARRLVPGCKVHGIQLIVDRAPAQLHAAGAAGWHATAAVMKELETRPVASDLWFGASCHSAEELARARALGADYVVLGPVAATGTHPDAPALRWQGFERLARETGLPVYAIGGLGPRDVEEAWRRGARGVAGISAYWRGLGGGGASGSGSDGIE